MDRTEYVNNAVEHFRDLLNKQIEREDKMKEGVAPIDFKSKDVITIGIVDGDGIGPIITKEAKKVLNEIAKDEIASGKIVVKEINGLTIENRKALGQSVPENILKEIKTCDVLLKGPTETPKGGTLESANVTLRRELDLYANIRPVSVPEEGIDWTFYRENTEGEYVLGSQGIEIPDTLAMDFKVTTDSGTRRIVRAACEFAKANGKNHLSIVTKANIMKKTDGKFTALCHEVADKYEGLTVEDYYIDIMTAKLIDKNERSKFKVFVLPNLYGDIITDEAAQIQGGVGTAGSANVGDRYAMFEAVHGTAPQLINEGKGEYANPMSIIKALEMLLRHIGLNEKANKLEKAIAEVAKEPTDGLKASEISAKIIAKM